MPSLEANVIALAIIINAPLTQLHPLNQMEIYDVHLNTLNEVASDAVRRGLLKHKFHCLNNLNGRFVSTFHQLILHMKFKCINFSDQSHLKNQVENIAKHPVDVNKEDKLSERVFLTIFVILRTIKYSKKHCS
jgi:hypothetical protein